MMSQLNLARKWRPKRFDEIAGQEFSVRMLKNSLYLNKLFSVYIFSGQRGCGKTSSARIFGAALNCESLSEFRKDPSTSIPCLSCASCMAMQNSAHPDFMEIDAASHTGVDNVRVLIDSASLLPLMGNKKIYLIDEAHMLSRAAFNALLKILEEPPHYVVFILATTELEKIPDTVRSRAFMVFFDALDNKNLKAHLKNLTQQENVAITDDALDLVISESEGSVRDAINIIERVRFLGQEITCDIMLRVLGKLSEAKICELFNLVVSGESAKIILFLNEINFYSLSPQKMWEMFAMLCRALIFVKHGVTNFSGVFSGEQEKLNNLAGKIDIKRLGEITQSFISQEELFLKTPHKHLFLEILFLRLAQLHKMGHLPNLFVPSGFAKQNCIEGNEPAHGSGSEAPPFENFLKKISAENDPAILSMLAKPKPVITEVKQASQVQPVLKSVKRSGFIDVSDKAKWPKANLLAEHFSGKFELFEE